MRPYKYTPAQRIAFRLGYNSGRHRFMPNRLLEFNWSAYGFGWRLGYKVSLALDDDRWEELA